MHANESSSFGATCISRIQTRNDITSFCINTSDARAEEAVPRLYGSTESKVSIRSTEIVGRSLKDSRRQLS